MVPRKKKDTSGYYIFEVYTYDTGDGWMKTKRLTAPNGEELKHDNSLSSKPYQKYLCSMKFESEKAAIEWFDKNQAGY